MAHVKDKICVCKDILACLFSVHNTIRLSCHEQVCLCYVSRDTSPIIGQLKWLCRAYLKEICGPWQEQYNLQIRRSCTMWLIRIIRQIKVIRQ